MVHGFVFAGVETGQHQYRDLPAVFQMGQGLRACDSQAFTLEPLRSVRFHAICW